LIEQRQLERATRLKVVDLCPMRALRYNHFR